MWLALALTVDTFSARFFIHQQKRRSISRAAFLLHPIVSASVNSKRLYSKAINPFGKNG